MAFTSLPNVYAQTLLNTLQPVPPVSTAPVVNDPAAMAVESLLPPDQGGTGSVPGQGSYYPVGSSNFGSQYGVGYPSGPGTTWGPRYSTGVAGPDDAWMAANPGPWQGTGLPNTGQQDKWGNTYLPVVKGAWAGQWVDPKSFPKQTTANTQLWGGPTSDDAPDWLKKIATDAANMPAGPAKTARIQHIMDSLMTPGSGISSHVINRVQTIMGISP